MSHAPLRDTFVFVVVLLILKILTMYNIRNLLQKRLFLVNMFRYLHGVVVVVVVVVVMAAEIVVVVVESSPDKKLLHWFIL